MSDLTEPMWTPCSDATSSLGGCPIDADFCVAEPWAIRFSGSVSILRDAHQHQIVASDVPQGQQSDSSAGTGLRRT